MIASDAVVVDRPFFFSKNGINQNKKKIALSLIRGLRQSW
ncbi:hypothetical protein BIFCAT_00202 [Bifidobacterium catenulatum DSM 16992 = JCM 1194 = LMG 11043]|uniref:Uncharacterized protein n=1 Tax=Bifidobacterium catenulatum DSM 16992 = JCM 1194 = LMG 11043 TaxID=566552 RepID=B6XSP6_9BIFI|nr:hypothetical protein BIFCAT_00202 [Bifidobacterium catenulatum DSM 16992 = JCM 1194 = LMG 11043]